MTNPKLLKEIKRRKSLRKHGPEQIATAEEMFLALRITGSYVQAAKILGCDESTIHNRLRPLRGTPQWAKLIAETKPHVEELLFKMAATLNRLHEHTVRVVEGSTDEDYMVNWGILATNFQRITPAKDGPTGPLVEINISPKEKSEIDVAFEKAKSRLGVQIQVSQNGK